LATLAIQFTSVSLARPEKNDQVFCQKLDNFLGSL